MLRDLVDKNVITFTVDENYLPFAKILVNSIKKNSPSISICGRFVNCPFDKLEWFEKNITVIRDNKNLSKKRNLKTKEGLYATDDFVYENKTDIKPVKLFYSELIAYCSNIKFDTILKLLKASVKNTLYVDADSIIRNDLTNLFTDLDNYDFCFYKDIPYSEQFDNGRLNGADFLYHGGLIGINNNQSTLNIIEKINEKVQNEIFDWDIDERVLPYIIKNNVKILEVEKKYKDEDLNNDSILWSGAGITKFNNDKYINECKKYK